MEDEASSFNLRSGTDLFVSRSHNVFDSLGALEDKHSAFLKATALARQSDVGLIKNDPDEDEFTNPGRTRRSPDFAAGFSDRPQLSQTQDSDYEARAHSRSPHRDTESGRTGDGGDKSQGHMKFKRPTRPPHRLGRQPIPDFQKHPEKYIQYSLRDVSENDMSERSNQRAALDFLMERKLEREKQEEKCMGLAEETFYASEAACSQGKITFSRPKHVTKSAVLDKSVVKEGVETSATCLDLDEADNDVADDTNDGQGNDVSKRNDPELPPSSVSFKSRKNVRRHIRTKDSDNDTD